MEAKVEVRLDRWGVPHVYAGNLRDMLFAQGFMHAQDRLFQMEVYRRLTAGRVAELFGTMGLPVEFTLLHHSPEPWTIVDPLAWARLMAWQLSMNLENEILRARLAERLGPEMAAGLMPPFPAHQADIVPPKDYLKPPSRSGLNNVPDVKPGSSAPGPGLPGPSVEGIGSNNWVVGGSRTSTGKPILANDMHLELMAPAIWFENHLVYPEGSITGVTFPGIQEWSPGTTSLSPGVLPTAISTSKTCTRNTSGGTEKAMLWLNTTTCGSLPRFGAKSSACEVKR